MKKCFKCGSEKPISDFYRHSGMADGYLGKCKSCTKSDVQRQYKKSFMDRREYEKLRALDPERKQKALEYQRRQRWLRADKYAARTAVSHAIRDGRLKKEPCKVCGEQASQAHHDDYSKPLDVTWLCFRHHRERHGQLRHLAIA